MKRITGLAGPHRIAANWLIAFLVTVVLVAIGCSDSTLATETKLEPQPHLRSVVEGGCPNPFTPINMLGSDGQAADRNADGIACYLVENGIIVSWTDNDVPLSQIGGCPNGFTFTYAKSMDPKYADVDHNGDGFACSRLTGNGSTLLIDNNDRPLG
jgi:hypothetical protein